MEIRIGPFTSVLVVALMIFVACPVLAGTYEISVTRKDSNLYKVDGKSIIIKTKYCYEYVYSSEAILRTSGRSGKLIFLEEDATCDVEAVFGKVTLADGQYSVTVSREEDDWYHVSGTDVYIQTSLCLNLALSEDALLKISIGGTGKLYFLDDEDICMVEALFEPLDL